MKRTLLDDLLKVYESIDCDYFYCSCSKCSKEKICDLIYDVIRSIRKFY